LELCIVTVSYYPEDQSSQGALAMQNPAKFREYAEECKKLAAAAKPHHKEKLLEIAKAWEDCAKEMEARVPK
jgi:hypothetical protein